MRPAIRVQTEYNVQRASDEATFQQDPNEEKYTRTEFTADCDINNIMRRGGVPIYTRNPNYGEVDYNTDLAQELQRVRTADSLFAQLPAKLREQYKNRTRLIEALDKGLITSDLKEWLASAPPQQTKRAEEKLLEWLEKNHTAPASSGTPTTAPQPTSAPAAASGQAGTA